MDKSRGTRTRKRRRKNFIMMERPLLESKAYKELSSGAKVCYMYFCHSTNVDHDNHPDVILTFKQAVKFGVAKSSRTFTSYKKELVGHGFIDHIKPGGNNEPALYRLSERWRHYGKKTENRGEYKTCPYTKNIFGHNAKKRNC